MSAPDHYSMPSVRYLPASALSSPKIPDISFQAALQSAPPDSCIHFFVEFLQSGKASINPLDLLSQRFSFSASSPSFTEDMPPDDCCDPTGSYRQSHRRQCFFHHPEYSAADPGGLSLWRVFLIKGFPWGVRAVCFLLLLARGSIAFRYQGGKARCRLHYGPSDSFPIDLCPGMGVVILQNCLIAAVLLSLKETCRRCIAHHIPCRHPAGTQQHGGRCCK